MSKFNDCVVSWYLQWAVLTSSAIVMLATGESFTIYKYMDWESWVIFIALAAVSIYSETVRFMALKI